MNKRDMFYQNVNQGYNSGGQFIPPSGYNMNTNYQAFGPNVMQNGMMNQGYQSFEDYTNDRLNEIEKKIKNLDTRLQKLESEKIDTTDNIYMI